MMKLALLAVLVGVTIAASPCCTPDQWEGILDVITGTTNDGTSNEVETTSMVSYDFKNQMMAATVQYKEGSMKATNRTIFNYRKKMMYNYNLNTLACTVSEFDLPFQKACTPPNSEPAGDFYYGTTNDQLKASAFTFTQNQLMGYFVVSTAGCIPINEVVYGSLDSYSFITTTEFVNITGGIKDPAVFDPPATCISGVHKAPLKDVNLKRGSFGLPTL